MEYIDYELGFLRMKECRSDCDSNDMSEFRTLEDRFRKNQRAEIVFGETRETQSEHAHVVYALNNLALRCCGASFTDFCMGKQPSPSQVGQSEHTITGMLRRIEDKIDRGSQEDRREATEILGALTQNQIGQAEVTGIVKDLRNWAGNVKRAGLPLDPGLRTVLETLTQHSGSAYQYLQVALPIIPGILSYNVELGSQHQADLRAIWECIKTRFAKHKTKGDGAVESKEPLYGSGNRWAVLIGINDYEDKANYGQLKYCRTDVQAIQKQLVAGGFYVARMRLLTDQTPETPTRAKILTALQAVANGTEPDDLLLFYYSGHGDENGGESYLVARDGHALTLADTAVSVTRVKEIMQAAKARAKVIILDACHSGADISGKGPKPMSEAFIRRVFEQAEGMAILAACKQGQLSYEWHEKKQGVFTYFLLEALSGKADRNEKGFVTVQDVSRHVTDGVVLWASQSNVSQKPTLEYRVAGDIVLVAITNASGA